MLCWAAKGDDMSAEAVCRPCSGVDNGPVTQQREPVPTWLMPPGGFVAADLDRLPELPPHAELIDGGLILMSPQRRFHAETVLGLVVALRRECPDELHALPQISVLIGERQRPEPDIVVVRSEAIGDGAETAYPAQSVVLVVEVVSPESQIRDRERKPQLYAAAGIKHFWRVEEEDRRPVVYVYELDAVTKAYVATGIHREQLKLTVPFALDVDLAAI